MESFYCSIACQTQHWKAGHKHKCVKVEQPSAAKEAAATPRPAALGDAAQGSGGGAGASHDEECAICLDALQQPQTMPCSHRFCRGCVAGMRQHGVGVAQVCPLCRGAMPDAERLRVEAGHLITQYVRWKKGQRGGAPLPAAVQELVGKAAALCREALEIDPADAEAHFSLGYALGEGVDKAGAEAAYRAAIAADPQHAEAHYNLGATLGSRGDFAGAARSFAAALKIDPSDADAKANLQLALRMLKEEHRKV